MILIHITTCVYRVFDEMSLVQGVRKAFPCKWTEPVVPIHQAKAFHQSSSVRPIWWSGHYTMIKWLGLHIHVIIAVEESYKVMNIFFENSWNIFTPKWGAVSKNYETNT
jgi:hypothetical protein